MHYNQSTETDRDQIDAMKKARRSQNEITVELNRSTSIISRELSRNQGLRGYRAGQAPRMSDKRWLAAAKTMQLTDEVRAWIARLRGAVSACADCVQALSQTLRA